MSAINSLPVDSAPLTGISRSQADAAARVVARMCPTDRAAILRALGLDEKGEAK